MSGRGQRAQLDEQRQEREQHSARRRHAATRRRSGRAQNERAGLAVFRIFRIPRPTRALLRSPLAPSAIGPPGTPSPPTLGRARPVLSVGGCSRCLSIFGKLVTPSARRQLERESIHPILPRARFRTDAGGAFGSVCSRATVPSRVCCCSIHVSLQAPPL